MPGTGVGIFWIDSLCKPFFKGYLLKDPLVILLVVCVLYGFVGYHVLKSAYLSDKY